jgi:drug/metabolite transporter (DMT)-like permease
LRVAPAETIVFHLVYLRFEPAEIAVHSPSLYMMAFLTVVIFSSAPACVKMVSLNTTTQGVVRLGLASLGMTIFLVAKRKLTWAEIKTWNRRTWQALALVGLAFGLHWLLFFSSIKLANAAIGAIGFSTYGLHLLLLGWALGFGKVGAPDIVGLLLACVGTYLLIPEFSFQNDHTVGLVIGILSGLAAAVLPLIHQQNQGINVHIRTWGQFTFALPLFFVLWPYTEWTIVKSEIPLILWLGLGIALVGHWMWVHVTTELSTTTVSILSYLYLPTSLIFGYLVLGESERLSGRMLVGTILVLIANALVLWSQAKLRSFEAEVIETV